NGLRGDLMDEELILKLKTAGAYYLTFAVETASPRIQKMLKKNLNLKKVQKIIELSDKAGILVNGFFMIGFPTETLEEIQQTINFSLHSKLHTQGLFEVVPFPGTELYTIAKKVYPPLFDENLAKMTFYTPSSFYKEVTGIDLRKISKRSSRRFYFSNPWRIIRFFWLIPKKTLFDPILLRQFLGEVFLRLKSQVFWK
ncbi:MAG: radical SAM protein, partial [Candidatus Edwardsbacteria bacterium]